MPYQCAFGCKDTGNIMHSFPNPRKFPERFKVWVDLVGCNWETLTDDDIYKKKRICSIHFTDAHRNRFKRLSALAIPTLYLPGESHGIIATTAAVETRLSFSEPTTSTSLPFTSTPGESHGIITATAADETSLVFSQPTTSTSLPLTSTPDESHGIIIATAAAETSLSLSQPTTSTSLPVTSTPGKSCGIAATTQHSAQQFQIIIVSHPSTTTSLLASSASDGGFRDTIPLFKCQDRRKRTCDSTEQSYTSKIQRIVTTSDCLNETVLSCTPSSSREDTSESSVSQTAGANVPEVLSEQKANEYVQASPASSCTTSPSPNQVVDDADPSFAEEDDDADYSNTLVESNMCRVCLALDVKMYDLRDNELNIMFQNITGIMFTENNYSVLGSLCWECAARLKAAATFRSKALLSNLLLQDLITSGEQIRKNDITALKESAVSQGLMSANTLTVIDVFQIVDIEEQNNTSQLLRSGDDGDQTSLSKNDYTEKSIILEIKEESSEMHFEKADNIAINIEIEDDPTSPNNEERNPKGENPLDSTSSSRDKINSAYSRLRLNIGQSVSNTSDILRSQTQENCDGEKFVINTISKSDLILRTRPQQITEPRSPTKRKKYSTSHDHTYYLIPDINKITRKKNVIIRKGSRQKVEKNT